MKSFYKIFFLFFITTSVCSATHLLGGEIRATNLSGLTYRISARVYFDAQNGNAAANAQTSIDICFGDGNTGSAKRVSYDLLSGDSKGLAVGIYETTYTYPTTGLFQISSSIANRSQGILNYTANSEAPMFLWTVINTQFANETPLMPYPIYTSGVKQILKIDFQPAATDSDSISAHLQKLSVASPGTCGVRMIDNQYSFPNDVSKAGTFFIDKIEKKLVWNAPDAIGKYLYAMVIDEWRNGIKISETYREGIIVIVDKPGPTVEIPPYVPATTSGVITANPDANYAELTLALDAYPVPTSDYLNVKVTSKYATTFNVQLISLEGRIIRELKTTAPDVEWTNQMDLRQISSGLYILKATDETGKVVTRKIVR